MWEGFGGAVYVGGVWRCYVCGRSLEGSRQIDKFNVAIIILCSGLANSPHGILQKAAITPIMTTRTDTATSQHVSDMWVTCGSM